MFREITLVITIAVAVAGITLYTSGWQQQPTCGPDPLAWIVGGCVR